MPAQNVDPGDILEVTIEGVNEGSPWAMVRHYVVDEATSGNEITGLIASTWEGSILTVVAPLLSEDWQAECLTITRVGPYLEPFPTVPAKARLKTMNPTFANFASPIVGGVSTDGIPNSSALVISLQTVEPGGRGRGRTYLCGIPEASTNGGRLLASLQDDFQNFGDQLAQTITNTGNTAAPVIFSRTSQNPLSSPPQATTEYYSRITEAVIKGNLGSQRRRRYRRNAFAS